MKILKKGGTKYEVFLDVIPEDIDDIYALYRVIETGDKIKSVTTRSICTDDNKNKSRVSLILEICVENVSVDLNVGILFIKGKILNETKHTKVGTFHTIDIPVHQRIFLTKESITAGAVAMLSELTLENKADIGYVLCRKETYSLILSSIYTVKRIFSCAKEKKKTGKEKTVKQIAEKIKEGVKMLVVVGEDKEIVEILQKSLSSLKSSILFMKQMVISDNTSKGDSDTIAGILRQPDVLKRIESIKYRKEILAANEYLVKEEKSSKGISTGQKETLYAAENYLIKKLIVVDVSIKSASVEERETVSQIIDLAKRGNADVYILSQHTPLGETLLQRGGVASILSQPMRISDIMQ